VLETKVLLGGSATLLIGLEPVRTRKKCHLTKAVAGAAVVLILEEGAETEKLQGKSGPLATRLWNARDDMRLVMYPLDPKNTSQRGPLSLRLSQIGEVLLPQPPQV